MTEQTTQLQKQFKILLVGDNCKDVYIFGEVNRISPEAPVPVFQPIEEIVKDGMAGNVLKNLEALGCEVDFYHNETSLKKRLIDSKSKQHLLRIDEDATCTPVTSKVFSEKDLSVYNAVVISDYNKGTVDYSFVEWIRRSFRGPIFVDTKKHDLGAFEGCFVKVNAHEYSSAKTLPSPKWLIVTRGENGAEHDGALYLPYTVDIADVCGAGDTFIAALTYRYLESKSIERAIDFANKAASITVQHVGVYAPTLEEIK